MWSGDTSPLSHHAHQAWLYRRAAEALHAQNDHAIAHEFDAMAEAESQEADRWDFHKPRIYDRLLKEVESFQ